MGGDCLPPSGAQKIWGGAKPSGEAYIRQLPGGVDALGGAGLDAAPGGIAKCADSEALLARSVDSWCWDDLSTPQSAEARASSALNAARG